MNIWNEEIFLLGVDLKRVCEYDAEKENMSKFAREKTKRHIDEEVEGLFFVNFSVKGER